MKKIFSFLIIGILFLIIHQSAYVASSPWAQTNWVGGNGQTAWSDVTKFSTSTNITSSAANQLTLTSTGNWYDSSWGKRKAIIINGSQITGTLTDYTALISLTTDADLAASARSDGNDILFTSSDGKSLMKFEIEKYASNGTLTAWVKIPNVAHNTNVTIYMYYGNANQSSSLQDKANAWDSGYVAVYHLGETSGQQADSKGVNSTNTVSVDQQGTAAGKADGADHFNGTNSLLTAPNTASLKISGDITLEAWINLDALPGAPRNEEIDMIRLPNSIAPFSPYQLRVKTSNVVSLDLYHDGSTFIGAYGNTALSSTGSWYYIAGVRSGSTPDVYLNGQIDTYVAGRAPGSGTIYAGDGTLRIGANNAGAARLYGIGDEVRISNTARPAAYFSTTYNNLNAPASFITPQTQETTVVTTGTLDSSIYDTVERSDWGTLSYTAVTPANTSVTVKVRTSNSSTMAGASDFSSCSAVNNNANITTGNSCATNGHRYVQYEVILSLTGAGTSPTFQSISLPFSASVYSVINITTNSKVYFGTQIPNAASNFSLIPVFESYARKGLSIFSWGIGFSPSCPTYCEHFDTALMNQVRGHGTIPMITWTPSDYSQGATQPSFSLINIINGNYDAYMTQFALDAKAWKYPFFLRFAHEMNGNWYPWSEQVNGNSAGQYVLAWKHVHDIFTANNVTNATWVWSPNVITNLAVSPESYYPGDAYVDWLALDGYNYGTYNVGTSWQTFSQIFGTTYNKLVQLAPSKPIMISEIGSTETGGNKSTWITDTFSTQIPQNYSEIKAVILYDADKSGSGETDWRIESSQAAIDAFSTAIAANYYAANEFGSISTSPIPPLGQSNNNSSTSNSSSNSNTAASCNDQRPGSKSLWLYSAVSQDGNSIRLYFADAADPYDKYVLQYGTSSGNYQYGSSNIGGKGTRSYLVSSLSPNTTYNFRVRAGNGCATGEWSNEISATTKSLISTNQLKITSSELIPQVNNSVSQTQKNTQTPIQKGYDVKVKVLDDNKKPVEGATVTLHSVPQTAKTDKNGIADFKNVEQGDHKVLIAYSGYQGEQSINLAGDVKEFNLNVTVKPQNVLLSPIVMGTVAVMGFAIVILIMLLLRAKRPIKS